MGECISMPEYIAQPTHVPPLEAWKVDPARIKKFYAPTDDRGFVLLDETVEEVKSFFHDDYIWPIDYRYKTTRPDEHHLHWIKRNYAPSNHNGNRVPMDFRELAPNKAICHGSFITRCTI